MLGYAKEIEADEVLTLVLDGHHQWFVEKALEAIAIVDDDERRPEGKRKSFNAVAFVLEGEDSLGWSKDSVERFVNGELNDLLPGPPVFQKWAGTGSGPGGRASQKERYAAFRSGIIAIAKAAGMDVSPFDEPNEGVGSQ